MARTRTIRDEDLLAAAREAFVERGFACSTKEIARRAGVSEGVLFQRYGSKAELFFAAMAPPEADLTSMLAAEDAGSPAHFEALGRLFVDYFREAVPVLLPLISHPDFRFEDFAQRHPDAGLVTLRREAMRYFAAIGAADPPANALLFITSTFGIAFFERLGAHGGTMPEEFVQRMFERIWLSTEVKPAKKGKPYKFTSITS